VNCRPFLVKRARGNERGLTSHAANSALGTPCRAVADARRGFLPNAAGMKSPLVAGHAAAVSIHGRPIRLDSGASIDVRREISPEPGCYRFDADVQFHQRRTSLDQERSLRRCDS